MNKDYSYDYEWDASYCYLESNVLINKLNIINPDALFVAEREITALKIAKAKDEPIKGKFNLFHLKKLNKFILCDIYSWAGKLRTANISKGNQFCLCNHLETYADYIFQKLEKENYLIKTIPDEAPKRLAYYLSEFNVLHLFREGNGRTQRLFIEYLANVAGFELDFSNVSNKEMIMVSAKSFAKEYEEINALFSRISSKTSSKFQESAIEHFFGKNSQQLNLFLSNFIS